MTTGIYNIYMLHNMLWW